jgi:hypothetical protein
MAKRATSSPRRHRARRRTRRALPRLARLYASSVAKELGRRPNLVSITAAASLVQTTSVHEAAHAVVGAYFGELPLLVTIERSSESVAGWGFVRWARIPMPPLIELARLSGQRGELLLGMRRHAAEEAMISLAGIAIEQARDPDALSLGDALWMNQDEGGKNGDVGSALGTLATFERNEDKRWRWMFDLAERTIELVKRPQVTVIIEKLAESLLNTPTIEGDRLERILMPVFGLATARDVSSYRARTRTKSGGQLRTPIDGKV